MQENLGIFMPGFRPLVAFSVLLGLAAPLFAQGMPDLVVDHDLAAQTVGLELKAFLPTDCALQPVDLCVDGPGARKLLRFTMETRNVGTADLVVDAQDPRYHFITSACHGHVHFVGFSRYELHPRGQPAVIAAGHKESFCIEDTHPFALSPPPPQYGCNQMGLTVGWGDRYDRSLDCQWIDVTEVPPGDYDLYIVINPQQLIPEADYTNNVAIVPVTIPADGEPPARITWRTVNAGNPVRSGNALRLRWRRNYVHARVQYQEIWLSLDDGASFELVELLASNRRHYDWLAPAVPVTTAARLKIVVWGRNLKRGIGVSAPFTIEPSSFAQTPSPHRRIRDGVNGKKKRGAGQ